MREKTKVYLAGVIDAEGCFCISQWKDRHLLRYGAYLDITSKDRILIQWIVDNFGGALKKISKKMPNGEIGYYYNWRIKNTSHLQKVLDLVSDFLQIKKNQSKVIKEWISISGNKNQNARFKLYEQIKKLKQEGVTTETLRSYTHKTLKAYLAGFFDGEGSIGPQRKIGVSNTVFSVLEVFKNQYGGTISSDKLLPNHKPSYHWQLYGTSKIERFLLATIPYLIVKKDKAVLLLKDVREHKDKIQSELHSDVQSDPAGTQVSKTKL